ncbi:MFS transporter [Chloroflexota bacterium]
MLRTHRKSGVFYGWFVVLACLVVLTSSMSMRYSFGVFFKALEDDFGLTRASTSGIFSIHMFLACIAALLAGWAVDRYGPRLVIVCMGLFTGSSLLLVSRASSVWHLYLSYGLLFALGTAAAYTVAVATTSRWFIKRRGIALGIATSGASLGVLIGAPVSAYLITSYGWRTSYAIMGLIAGIIIVGSALFLRKDPAEMGALPDGEMSDAVEVATSGHRDNRKPELSLFQATRTRTFWLLIFTVWAYSFCLHMVLTHLVRHAIDLEISPVHAATVLTFIASTGILGRLAGGRISDRIGRRKIAIACAFLQAAAMLILMGSVNIWMLYLFAMLYGPTYGAMDPIVVALVVENFGLRSMGAMMGMTSIFFGIGGAAGPALAGYVFDVHGSYTIAFITGVVVMLLSILSFCLLKAPAANN